MRAIYSHFHVEMTLVQCTVSMFTRLIRCFSIIGKSSMAPLFYLWTWKTKGTPVCAGPGRNPNCWFFSRTGSDNTTAPGADPGFLEWGFKVIKGGSFSPFYPIFPKFTHENKIIWFQRGVRANPLNPL